MSLRGTAYVAYKPPRGLKNAKWPFSINIALHLKKVCYKVSFFVQRVSDKVVRHSLAYLSVQNVWWGTSPFT